MRLPTANALSVYDNVHVYAEDCIAKRGTDPVTKKQVLTHCCAATGSIVGVSVFVIAAVVSTELRRTSDWTI